MTYEFDWNVKAYSKGAMRPLQARRYHMQVERIRYKHQRVLRSNLLRAYRAELDSLLELASIDPSDAQAAVLEGEPLIRTSLEEAYVSIAYDMYPMMDRTDRAKALYASWETKKGKKETAYEAAIRQWVRDECGIKITFIDNTVLEQVRRAYEASANQVEFREELAGIFDSPFRCNAIARTETACATNRASVETMRSLDFQGSKSWMAVGDIDTRDTHAQINGMTVPFDGWFEWTSKEGLPVRMECPLDHKWSPPASEVVNCRCDVIFEMRPAFCDYRT